MLRNLVCSLVIVAAPMFAQAAANFIALPLIKESISSDRKLCFFMAEINLGDSSTVKPFQLFTESEKGKYEEIRNGHQASFNQQGEFVLKVSSSSTVDNKSTCPAKREILLLGQ